MKWMRYAWLCLSLVTMSASTAGAQLIDFTWPDTSKDDEKAEPTKSPRAPAEPAPRTERERRPRPDASASRETVEASAPQRLEPPRNIARPQAERPQEPPSKPAERNTLLILFLTLLGVGVLLFAVERARSWITTNVGLRRVLGGAVLVLRLTAAGLLLGIVLELIPEGQDWILWALVVFALVIGWSIRDLFADLVAGGIIAAERRVKKGVWVSGEGFQGTVEGRSLRATWLRDGQGHRLTVPNRAMVGAPMVYDAGADAEHEVVVRLEGYDDAGKVRMALTDAILSSPWVLAGANPVVLRDPADPVVWRVRTKLLEPRFSVHFEGELLERVEDLLRYVPVVPDREAAPSEPSPKA